MTRPLGALLISLLLASVVGCTATGEQRADTEPTQTTSVRPTPDDPTTTAKPQVTAADLSPEEYAVLRQAGTERAFTGEYTDTETTGVYRCKACQAKLFESDTKFHSGCGWPSFYQPISDTIQYLEDNSHGMKRVEVRCANCGSHLGHVFPDGYGTPTGDRYCINSISLTLEPADKQD